MTGTPEFTYPNFATESGRLRPLDYGVLRPAEINLGVALGTNT